MWMISKTAQLNGYILLNGMIIPYDHMYVWSSTWSMGQPKLSGGTPETSWSVLEKTNFSIIILSHHQHDQVIGASFIISILDANSPVITISMTMMMMVMMMMMMITCRPPPSPRCKRNASTTRPLNPWRHKRHRRQRACWGASTSHQHNHHHCPLPPHHHHLRHTWACLCPSWWMWPVSHRTRQTSGERWLGKGLLQEERQKSVPELTKEKTLRKRCAIRW